MTRLVTYFLCAFLTFVVEPGVSSAADGPIPFGGSFSGELTFFAPFSPDSSPECNANFTGDPSAPGAVITAKDVATGVFSGMGKSQLDATSCVDPNSPYSGGHGVITAADGDKVFIEFDNYTQPDPDKPGSLILTGSQWLTGGTGRFVDASGTQQCKLHVTFTSPTTAVVQGTCIGTIQYNALSGEVTRLQSSDASEEPERSGVKTAWGVIKSIYR